MNETKREKKLLEMLNKEIGNDYTINYDGEYETTLDMHFEVYEEIGEVDIELYGLYRGEEEPTKGIKTRVGNVKVFFDNETDEEIVKMVEEKIKQGINLD